MKEVRGVSFQQLSPLSQSSVLDVGAAAAAFLQPLDRIPAERSAQCLLHLCFPTDFTELGEGGKKITKNLSELPTFHLRTCQQRLHNFPH